MKDGIDANKSPNKSKECSICHYWYILGKILIMRLIFVMAAMM